MNFRRYLLLSSLLSVAFSCSFNRAFLHPQKGSLKPIPVKSDIPDKTIVLKFDPKNYRPFILSGDSDTSGFNINIESFIFYKSDSTALNGWLLKPKDHEPQITIINFHGNSGSLFSQFATLSPLVTRGFQIFMFDYSGFGFSEGRATRKNTLSDAHTAVAYALRSPDIIDKKIIFYGQSYGGHLAASIAHIYQENIDALVIEGAFDSPRAIASFKAGFAGRILTKTIYSGIDSIKKYTKPLLIIHSKNDREVPFSMAMKYFEVTRPPKELFVLEGPHLSGPTLYADEIAAKIIRIIGN